MSNINALDHPQVINKTGLSKSGIRRAIVEDKFSREFLVSARRRVWDEAGVSPSRGTINDVYRCFVTGCSR